MACPVSVGPVTVSPVSGVAAAPGMVPGGEDEARMAAIALRAALRCMSGPFAWGARDCCTSACDAFRVIHGIDPMGHLRDRYRGRAGAERLIRDAGGMPALAGSCARAAGLVAGTGAPGELGLTARGALVLGLGFGRWAGKAKEGLQIVTSVERSWACPRS